MKRPILSVIVIVLLGAILLASCTNDSIYETESGSNASYGSESDTTTNETTTSNETVSDVTSSDETSSIESEDSEVNMSKDESEPDTSSSNENSFDITSEETSDTSSVKNETSNVSHKHSYKKTVVNPTCTEKGYTKNVCSCGDSYISDEKPTVEHNMKIESEVASTQNTRGKCVYKCSYGCGTTKTEEFYSIDELCKLISKYTLQYINEFRVAEGKPALIVSKKVTEYAEYRAMQALQGGEHRGHNLEDIRLAVEATKCGTYSDYTRYYDIAPQWSAEGMEAYGMGGAGFALWSVVGDDSGVKSAAIQVAEACHNSSEHWAYVGASKYVYVGVGTSLTYNGGLNNYVVVYRYNPDETGYRYSYYDEDGNLHEEWVKP